MEQGFKTAQIFGKKLYKTVGNNYKMVTILVMELTYPFVLYIMSGASQNCESLNFYGGFTHEKSIPHVCACDGSGYASQRQRLCKRRDVC
jgi:hypothetical protein